MASLLLQKLTADARSDLISVLWESQGHKCFICEEPIDLEVHADNIDVDHIEPLSQGGKDDKTNFAATHATCNRQKQAAPLVVARALARFSKTQSRTRDELGRGANLSDILAEFGGARFPLTVAVDAEGVRFGFSALDDARINTVPLYEDPLSRSKYFFAQLPIEYLHHDDKINPRNIGSNLGKLLTEFHYGRPQLHVSLAWISTADAPSMVRVFDGQHKATAQVLLGTRSLPVRVFVDPDTDLLLQANTNAGTTLRQVAFDKSVQRRLGSSLFHDRLDRYRADKGLPDDALNFSETDLVRFFKGESRELKRYVLDNQREQITSHLENKLSEYMDYAGKGSEKPLSYNTIEKTFYSFFISPNLLETRMDHEDGGGGSARELEVEQIVRLMNIVADEVFIGKFDTTLGTARIEHKVQKGEIVPPEHLRAFRMSKEEVMHSWLGYVKQIVTQHFGARGVPHDPERLFQYPFTDVLWRQLHAYVENLAALPLWINGELSATVFGGKQTYDFWRTIWESGKTPEGTAVLAEKLDLLKMTQLPA